MAGPAAGPLCTTVPRPAPLSRPVTEYVRLPVIGTSYAVYDHRGQAVAAQLNPIPEHIRDIPGALIRFYIQHANKILWKYPYSQ